MKIFLIDFISDKKLIISILISCFIHILIFIVIPNTSFIQPLQAIQVQIDETPINTSQRKQQVEQYSFNYKTPMNVRYASQHDNSVDEEVKNSMTGMTENPLFKQTDDHYLNSSDFSMKLSKKLPGYAGRIDFLKDVKKEGSKNNLNTEKLLFNSFYSRVKHQLYWHWLRELDVEIAPSLLRENKHIPFFTTYIEALLDRRGYLKSIKIRKKSGLEMLDSMAVSSINKAHPFSNPPRSLISKNGFIQLNYSFTLINQQHSKF